MKLVIMLSLCCDYVEFDPLIITLVTSYLIYFYVLVISISFISKTHLL